MLTSCPLLFLKTQEKEHVMTRSSFCVIVLETPVHDMIDPTDCMSVAGQHIMAEPCSSVKPPTS